MQGFGVVVASQPGGLLGDQDARRESFTGPAVVGWPQCPHRADHHADPDQPENDGKHVAACRRIPAVFLPVLLPFLAFSIMLHASTSRSRAGKWLRYRRIGLNS